MPERQTRYVLEGADIVAIEDAGRQIGLDPPVPLEELDQLREAYEYLGAHIRPSVFARGTPGREDENPLEWEDDESLKKFISQLTSYQRAFMEVLAERGERWTLNSEIVRQISTRTGGEPVSNRATAGIRSGLTRRYKRWGGREPLDEWHWNESHGHYEYRIRARYLDMVRRALA